MKLILSEESEVVESVPPTICLTLPACRSTQGRNRVIAITAQRGMCSAPVDARGVLRLGDILASRNFGVAFCLPSQVESNINFTAMAPTLGKRKRLTRAELEQSSRSPSPPSDASGSDHEDLQAIFRRAFEAKFAPIEVDPLNKAPKETILKEEDPVEELDWSGISSEEDDGVEVVEYKDSRQEKTARAPPVLIAFAFLMLVP